MSAIFYRAILLLALLVLLNGCATHHDMSSHHMSSGAEADHSAHKAMMNQQGYSREIETYKMPNLLLTDNLGQKVAFDELLDTDKPVIVNFIYATCTTICPLLSLGYVDLQRELGADTEKVVLISVTIDPEHDTPEVLEQYRKRFGGKPGWTLLTGSRIDIDNVMTAFDAYIGDKMDHQPLNFIHLPEKNKWVRLNGMMNGKEFLHELELAGVMH